MKIRDRIFDKLDELNMSQKEFSEKTGIPQTTISDWRKKKTNPKAEKILIICKVLNVNPEWLLSGVEQEQTRSNPLSWYAIDANTDSGKIITAFNSMNKEAQQRLMGYVEALTRPGGINV